MIDTMTRHLIRRLRANRGQEDGDPGRAARVILDVVDLDETANTAAAGQLCARARGRHNRAPVRRGPEVGLPQREDGFPGGGGV